MAGIVGKVQYVLECGTGCNSEQFLFSPCRSLSSGIKSPSDQSGTERGFRHKEQFSCRAIPARARAHGHARTQTSNHINLDFFHHAYTLSLSISPRLYLPPSLCSPPLHFLSLSSSALANTQAFLSILI